ncbi:MAG TPA: glycosyltransferase family 9 protein, partial [Stellaceae bacterium]|nr:glycosyltransferase family 9 protein [Stellaceae bacterium]
GLRRPPMQLHVDQLSVDERGILQVEGWAVSLAPLVSVQLFLEEERIGAADYGKPREDVAASHPEFPNARFSGFRFKTDLRRFGSGRKSLKIQAISLGGITRELIVPVEIADRAEPAHVPAAAGEEQNSLLHCDAIQLASDGRIAVAGWAIGRAPTEAIAVLVDGAEAGLAEIGLDRPDVGNHFPTIAHARLSGFKFAAKLERTFEGEHLVVLRIKSSGEEREIPLPVLAVEVAAEAPSTPTAGLTDGSDLKLVVDAPAVVGGAVASPVRNRLEINGWALARAGVASVDIALDGNHLLSAYYGVRRIDVQSAFPDWGDALGSGFTAMLPQRVLPKGRRLIGVTLRDKAGKTATVEFHVEVEEPPEHFGPWSLRRRLPQAEINFATHMLAERDWRPAFTLVMPVANGDDAASVERSVACARAQAYADWRLLLAPEGGSRNARRLCDDVIAGTQGGDARVQILPRSARQSPGALVAEGGFLGILKPGDELGCDALMEMALTSSVHRDADFIYADDRRVNPATGALDAFFKPQWSPDLVLSTNYIGRTWWARADLVGRLAASVDDLLQHGDWDIVLRATELARAVRHIPAVLCEMSAAANDDARAERAALARAMKRRRIAGKVEAGRAPGAHRMRRDVTTKGLVSIIIPTCAARGLIKTCLETLRKMTAYRNFEIICIENIPDDQRRWKRWVRAHADKVLETHEPFNWSRFNNLAAAEAKGEFLLFLNDDIEIIAPDWLDALLEHAQRSEVGAVGPQLLYPDRRVQHAGMFLAGMGQARHAFRYAREDEPGYFGLALTQRNAIAVTGACLLTRRATFDALGRFDEAHNVINNDLDYCLRAWRRGLVNVYTPHSRLIHHEQISRGHIAEEYNEAAFDSIWRHAFALGDPYFHPRLSKEHDDFSFEWEPTQVYCAGHPALSPADVRNILIVKLDHIGDCVIALPAVRRLKRHFPEARISVLAGSSSAAVWSLEPAVDETITFDFFHARSQLGRVEIDEADLIALRRKLDAHRFDLAVDMRKHPETRHVLQYTGARCLAGFDHRGQFPFLDIALEWSGDQSYVRKRQHTAGDLVNLVDAVASACESERQMIAPMSQPARVLPEKEHRALFAKPVVCVHPAAGNEMKQWPPEYFAALIDVLVERDGCNIAIVGGNDDAAIAAEIVGQVRHRDAITSLVGKLKLKELPVFMAACALFVGNDSGPKHIAAGLGVPTVGIHAGVVDAKEWGPIGASAVAVEREMTCSPCYLFKADDCRRGLACLTGLSPGDVYRACRRLLRAGAPKRRPKASRVDRITA